MVCETYFRALGCILPCTNPWQTKASQSFHSIVLQMISLCLLSLNFFSLYCWWKEEEVCFVLFWCRHWPSAKGCNCYCTLHDPPSHAACSTTVLATWRAIVVMNMQMVMVKNRVICHSAWEVQLSPGSLTGLNDVIQQDCSQGSSSTQSNLSPTGQTGLKQEKERLFIFRPYRLNVTAPEIEHCECMKVSFF